ncbi:MAG TPA: flagellar basal body P-ring formation chaperone FlgA [Geobacteraceae bacterium]|nr:flagellar basal body P-ring formation chaperone FlgA [Geobacteraceae bacterium]
MKLLFKYMAIVLAMTVVSAAFAASDKLITVKEAKIREEITGYIMKCTENMGMDINVANIGFTGDLKLPQGETSYEVIAPRQWEGWGRANLALIIRVNGRVEKNLSIPVEVTALTDMVVTDRPLERGEIIGPSDVVLRKRDIAGSPGKICRDLSEVVGKRVKVAMRGNSTVRSDYLERVPLIKSGQMVTIIAENDVMRITAVGKARNSGAEGDLIMVQNMSSLKDIPARVVDGNSVKVDF